MIEVQNDFRDWSLGQEIALALLGSMEDVVATRHVKLFLFYALYYARRQILLSWKQPTQPTVNTWIAAVDSVFPLYKLSRNCQKKFDNVWLQWIDAYGLTSEYLVNVLYGTPLLAFPPGRV